MAKKYNVRVDMSRNRAALAEIEQGGPVRHFTTDSLSDAVLVSNLVLMASGLAMRRGPRSIRPGFCYSHTLSHEHIQIEIQRLKA